jgi:Fe-S cluster assembly protein SufD
VSAYGERFAKRANPTHAAMRSQAIAAFEAVGIPTPRSEDFKYTSLAAIGRAALELDAPVPPVPEPVIAGTVGGGVALTGAPDLGTLLDGDPFDLLNTAFFDSPVLVEIPAGTVSGTIHLVHRPSVRGSHPRVLVIAGENSSLSLIEHFVGPDDAYLSNPVTEVFVRPGAKVSHTRIVEEGPRAFHVGSIHVRAGRDGEYALRSFALGGSITRCRVELTLDHGARVELVGLALAGSGQTHDHHVFIDHAAPHATSRQTFKGVVASGARHVFTGKVIVRKDAQKTDSAQSVRNLLLADDAIANARPQLEILADDVKCQHGATVGRLDDEALFYLRTRGIGVAEARAILTTAFASELVDGIAHEGLKAYVDHAVRDALARLEVSA